MTLFNTTFKWTPSVAVRNDNNEVIFNYSRTRDVKANEFFEITIKTSKVQSSNSNAVVSNSVPVLHNPFSIFVKGHSNYFGIKGKFLNTSRWDPEDDSKVQFLKDNFADSPFFPNLYYMKNVNFNQENRLFFYTIDFADANKNVFEYSDKNWNFDGYPQIRAMVDNTEIACIMPKNPSNWKSKTCFLYPGETVTYTRTSSTAYLFVLSGPVIVNDSTELKTDDISKINSNSITFSVPNNNIEFSMLLIKESVDE